MNFAFLQKKEFIWLVALVTLFLILRLPGIHHPYHQDEYKWPQYADPALTLPGAVPHPPLTEFIYRVIGHEVGYNNFRFIPIFFSTLNLILIFCLSRIIFGNRVAFWTASLFAISFFSILASLMVDVDGAVMPTFFLTMTIGYYQLRKMNFQFKIYNFQNYFWLFCLIIGAIGGFLTKMSGVLPIMAIALDFAIIKGFFSDKKRFLNFIWLGLGLALAVIIILLLAKLIFPFFPIEKSIEYWKHFANSSSFTDRGWLQTFIQFVKAILYTSPLLVLPPLFIDREIWDRVRPFLFFILIGLVFYLLIFDFSLGALDRYLQFLIIPLCIISGAVFSRNLTPNNSSFLTLLDPPLAIRERAAIGFIGIALFFSQFLDHFVPAMYPKTEWLSRIISFKWDFLYPFSGGSGPVPFYVSFLFIALIWVLSIVFVLITLKVKSGISKALFLVLVLGVLYNSIFTEEYLFGKINGSAPLLIQNAVAFIKNDPGIKKVIVYNDNGGFDVKQAGRYQRRMYTTPQFEDEYKKLLNNFYGHILFVEIPKVKTDSFYATYMNSCKTVYTKKDRYITARILDCSDR